MKEFESKNEGINYTAEEISYLVEKFKKSVADIKAHKFEPDHTKRHANIVNIKRLQYKRNIYYQILFVYNIIY